MLLQHLFESEIAPPNAVAFAVGKVFAEYVIAALADIGGASDLNAIDLHADQLQMSVTFTDELNHLKKPKADVIRKVAKASHMDAKGFEVYWHHHKYDHAYELAVSYVSPEDTELPVANFVRGFKSVDLKPYTSVEPEITQ